MTETPLNPKANREKMIIIVFETYKFRQCLYGRITGIVLDTSDGNSPKTSAVAFYLMSYFYYLY
jgi:hypothetical protein